MLVHLGGGTSVRGADIVTVLDGARLTADCDYLIGRAKAEARYRGADAPKSYVIVRENGRNLVYGAVVAVRTLKKRIENHVTEREE